MKQIPINTQLAKRIDQTRIFDENTGSPYLMKIDDCCKVIEDLEAEKKGTPDEKSLSNFDKYKISVIFMQML